MLWQLLKMDNPTRERIGTQLPATFHPMNGSVDSPLLFAIDPLIFTHAYMLLGSDASKFGHDLSLYLSTVKCYFERTGDTKTLCLAPSSQDARRRLAEDLGVAFASLFVVHGFQARWQTMSQIPLNNTLSKKRPDFQAFDGGGKRILFEAKGTSIPGKIENALGKAIGQVKGYPENAAQKLAIVSFLSADPRIFDSATFVVDPAMPEITPPDEQTSIWLHYERALQFAGFGKTANAYLRALARSLRDRRAGDTEEISRFAPPTRRPASELETIFNEEAQRAEQMPFRNNRFIGRRITHATEDGKFQLFLGISESIIETLLQIETLPTFEKTEEYAGEGLSAFDDGTLLHISLGPM